LHGGTIEVGGDDGEQTRFTIRLPRLIEQMANTSPPLVA
jgi:signal transduction histidine kinase